MEVPAAAVSVAAEWQLLYNRYYRKPEIYTLNWKHVDLSRNKVACAPFGGPIAIIRDDSKIVQLYAESALRKLRIFNSAGVKISETVWRSPGGRLVGMSWTDDQILVCIVQDGTAYRYNIHGEMIKPNNVSLGKECFEHSVVECVFWGNGVVCINENFQLFCIPDFKNLGQDGGVIKLADPILEELPLCITVIEPQYTMSGNVEVLLAVGEHVLQVEEDGVQQIGEGVGPIQKMVVTRNGKLIASFTHDGRLLGVIIGFLQDHFRVWLRACGGANYAKERGIPVALFPKSKEETEGMSPEDLVTMLRKFGVDIILLAGYLKLIPEELVQAFPKRIVNIHPSLLPAFGGKGYYGMKVHKAVVASGARYSGATVHFVDEEYDQGRILAQRAVPVLANDTADVLAARVLHEEHSLYVEVAAALCEDWIVWRDDGVPLLRNKEDPDNYS